MSGSAMVPPRDWGSVAEGFREATGRQVTLCAVCVTTFNDTTPPAQIVLIQGTSYCVDHAKGSNE